MAYIRFRLVDEHDMLIREGIPCLTSAAVNRTCCRDGFWKKIRFVLFQVLIFWFDKLCNI